MEDIIVITDKNEISEEITLNQFKVKNLSIISYPNFLIYDIDWGSFIFTYTKDVYMLTPTVYPGTKIHPKLPTRVPLGVNIMFKKIEDKFHIKKELLDQYIIPKIPDFGKKVITKDNGVIHFQIIGVFKFTATMYTKCNFLNIFGNYSWSNIMMANLYNINLKNEIHSFLNTEVRDFLIYYNINKHIVATDKTDGVGAKVLEIIGFKKVQTFINPNTGNGVNYYSLNTKNENSTNLPAIIRKAK